jgi:hypothetical protein
LLRWTQFSCLAQLTFADHVHDLDTREGYLRIPTIAAIDSERNQPGIPMIPAG